MADKPVDDLGKMNSDVLSEFDIDVEEPKTFGRKVAAPVKGVANIIGHTAGGAISGVTNEIKNRFPHTAGLVGDAMGVVDDIKSLKDDVTSELTPAWNTLKGITLKMMPMTKLLMPKSLYSKIEKKLKDSYEPEDERSEQQKLEESRTENINQQLSAIFSAQMEMQQTSEAKASAEKQADRLLERTHFKAEQAVLSNIDQKLQAANMFLSGAFTAYMKKSLELKYRHLYVASDIFNTVRVLTKITEARLEEIKHNTGLPEYAKVTMKERLIGSMKDKTVDTITSFGAKLKDQFIGNFKEKLMGDIKSFTRGFLPMLASSAGMFSDPSMVGGPIKKSDILGKIIGFFTGMSTSEKTAGFLDSQAGHIGDMENMIESFRKYLPFIAHDKIETLKMSDNPIARYIAEALPARNIDTKIDTKSLIKDPNAVVPFDVSTRAAITQVIPAHLERIGNYVEGFVKKVAPDLVLEEKTFNYVTQRLSSIKEFQNDLENEVMSEDQRARNLEDSLSVTMGIAKNNKKTENLEKEESIKKLSSKKGVEGAFFDSEEFRELQQQFITNMMGNQQFFQFGDIVKYLDGDGKTDWFKKAFKGLKEDEIQAVCKYYDSICRPYGGYDETAVTKIRNMSMEVLGSSVIDVNMRQLYQQLGAGRHDRWTDAKTGESVNISDWYNKRHEDSSGMYEKAEWISDTVGEERERHKLRVAYNKKRDDKETMRYRAQARELGFGAVAEYLPPELVKIFGDLTTKVAQPFMEKASEVVEAVKDRVNGITDNSFLGKTVGKVKKSVKKILKANSVEIHDAYMKNSNTLHIIYDVKDIEGHTKARGDFDVRSSLDDNNWNAPSWDDVLDAWKNHEREELWSKLTKAEYEKAVKTFQERGTKDDAKSYEKWRRPQSTKVTGKDERLRRASDDIVEQALSETTKPSVSETPSENNYIDTMRYEVHNALTVDIPSKIQSIITMMHDSDLFIKSEKHGSSDNAHKDTIVGRLNEGELVLNEEQQKRLVNILNGPRNSENKIQHQDELMRVLGMDVDDDFTPLFSKGGRVRRRKNKNKNKNKRNKKQQVKQTIIPRNSGVSMGNKIADVVDTGVEKVTKVKDVVVDTAKEQLDKLAQTSLGKRVVNISSSVYDTVTGWFTSLKDTISNRSSFLEKFPEKWRDRIGSVYDTVVTKSNAVGDYFTTLTKDLKLDKASQKLTDSLKSAAESITDPTARRHFIISATQQMINIKDIATDPNKRSEAMDKAKKELEALAEKLKNIQSKDKNKGIKGFLRKKWVQAKMLWRKVKRSKFGKWVGSLIDDETKAKIKSDFADAKSSIKDGWATMSDKVKDAFGIKDKKTDEPKESPNTKLAEQTQDMIDSMIKNNSALLGDVPSPKDIPKTEQSKPEEVKTESGEKVSEGVSKEAPKKEEPKPTTSEKAITPSDKEEKSMFEGEPESRFHADFRTFANKLFTVLGNLKISGSVKGGKGLIGGALSGLGKGFGGLVRGIGSAYGGVIRGAGSAIGGIARGAGTAISGIANSGVPSALINGTGSLLGGLVKGYGSLAGGLFKGIGAGVGGIAKGVGNLFGGNKEGDPNKETLGDKARRIGSSIRNFITGDKPKYVDIYWKDMVQADMILLSAKQQEDGVQFEDGSRVESSYDIDKPVFGKKPGSDELQCLITADDIKHGLVDVNNKPIVKSEKSKGSIFDKMGLTGKLFKLGGKLAGGLMDFWGGLLGIGGKGLGAIGKGAKSLLGKLFGIDGQDFSDYHNRVLERLDRIIVLMGGEPPKDSGVKPDEVKKDEPKSSDVKPIEDVKEGLTPTEYPGVFKNKQGRYVDAKGKFVKDPTKQPQSTSEAKPEETKEPEQKKQEVTDESGDKVAEGVAKDSAKEDKKAEKEKEQEKAEEAKQESLFKRIVNFFGKSKDKEDKGKAAAEAAAKDKAEDAEKNKKAQEEFVERNKKREEERKKSEEDKKKRQAERDAVNDKAEKEGAARLASVASGSSRSGKYPAGDPRNVIDYELNRNISRIKRFGRHTVTKAKIKTIRAGRKLKPVGTFIKNQAIRQKDMAIGQAKWLYNKAKPPYTSKVGRLVELGAKKYVGGMKFVGQKAMGLGSNLVSGSSSLLAKIPGVAKFGTLAKTGLAATKAGWAAAGLKGAALAGGKAALALATNPVGLAILGTAAAGLSLYKGIKGSSKANTKKNLGIKEGVGVQDRVASGLSQALTFGLGGKRAAKFTRKMLDYSPAMGMVKLFMGDKDAMTDKEIRIFRTKCENKIKKGMKSYETILARFNKAVRTEDWPMARSISGNEASIAKNLMQATGVTLAYDIGKGIFNTLFGNDDKPLTPQQINAFRKKLSKRVAKKDKMAEKLLSKFNDAVSEENWKLARELSGKKAEGWLNSSNSGRNVGMLAGLALGGPLGMLAGAVVGDFLNDPDKKPMSKKEIEETVKFLSKQAAYNPKAKPILDKFQEAVENEDWKTARKLSGKEGKYLATKILKVAGKGLRIGAGIMTLGLSELMMPGDQDKPLTEKEIQDYRSKMQFRIKKGDGMASRKLEAFDDAIAQQKWSKARRISKIKDEANITKVGKFLKKISWDWIIGNDEEPMTEAEQQKFRESMQRKIKMGDKQAQRKLDAFEDAVGNQKWKRARMISKMSNDGWGTKAVKAVGSFFSGLFGSDDAGMTELEIKKFRDKMNDEIKSGNKAAQKKLDKFEDAVADQNWRRARAIAETPNKNILSKMKDWTVKAFWSGDQDSAMTDAEVEKFENEMNGRIQKGDTNAQKLLDQFHEAVSNGLWSKARKISGVQKDGLLKAGLKKAGNALLRGLTFGLFGKGDASAEEVNKLQEQIEEKADEDESGLWQKVLDRFMSLKSQGMYNQARDYGEKMLSSSLNDLKTNAKENKNVDEMEAEVRIKKRQKDIVDNIMKSSKKLGWFGNAGKKRELAILLNKAKFATDVDDDFLNGIEEELSNIDSEAEITKDSSSYKIDEPIRKMMKAQAKLRDVAVNAREKISFWRHPFQWRSIRKLVDELTNTVPDELTDEKILDWNNRLSEISGTGIKKLTKEDLDKKKQEIEEKRNKEKEGKAKTPAEKMEESKPVQGSKTIQVGNVTIKKNADGSRQTSVVDGKTPTNISEQSSKISGSEKLGALNKISDSEISAEVKRILKENNLDDSEYDNYVVKAIKNLAIKHPAYKGLGIGLISGLAKMRAKRHTKQDGTTDASQSTQSSSDQPKETILGVAKQTVGSLWNKAKNAAGSIGRSIWGGLKKGLTLHGEAQMAQANAISSIFGKKKTDDESNNADGTLTDMSQGSGSIGERIGYGMGRYRISGDEIAKEMQNSAGEYKHLVQAESVVRDAVSNLVKKKYKDVPNWMKKSIIGNATLMFIKDNAASGKYPYPKNVIVPNLNYTKTTDAGDQESSEETQPETMDDKAAVYLRSAGARLTKDGVVDMSAMTGDTKPLHSGLFDWFKSKAKSAYSALTDGDDLSTDWAGFKHVLGKKWDTVKRYLKNPFKAYQDDKSEREEFMRLMSMPRNEAIAEVGEERYKELRRRYFNEQTQSALSLRDRWTGKQFVAKAGSSMSATDKVDSKAVDDKGRNNYLSEIAMRITGGTKDFSGTKRVKDYYSPEYERAKDEHKTTYDGNTSRSKINRLLVSHVDPRRLSGITDNDMTTKEYEAKHSGRTSAVQDLEGIGDAIAQAQRGQTALGRLWNRLFTKDAAYEDTTTYHENGEEVPWWKFWKKRPLHSGLFDWFKSKANKLKDMSLSKLSSIKDTVSSLINPAIDNIRNLPYEAAVSFDKYGNIFDAVKGTLFGADVAMPKDGVVVHNHPDGSPVSGTDLESAKSAGVRSMVTLTPDKINDSIVKPVSSSVFDSISNLGSKVISHINDRFSRSGLLDSDHIAAMEKHSATSKLLNREQQMTEANISDASSAEEAATRDQTQVLGEKLDNLTYAVYGVRDATVEAGEGTSQRINNAQNQAIAQSAAYANSAISQTRPKPKEPGLKPASISTKRPVFA